MYEDSYKQQWADEQHKQQCVTPGNSADISQF